jgi:hypothetical protein
LWCFVVVARSRGILQLAILSIIFVLEQPEAFLDFIALPGRDAVKVGACHLENGFKFCVRQVTLKRKKEN